MKPAPVEAYEWRHLSLHHSHSCGNKNAQSVQVSRILQRNVIEIMDHLLCTTSFFNPCMEVIC